MKNTKITELNQYSKKHTLHNIRNAKRKKTVRRRATAIVISGFSLIVLASLPVLKNKQATIEYEEEAIELAEQLEQVIIEKEEIAYKVSLLEDEDYVAKLARKEFNFSKENEILINIPELEESETGIDEDAAETENDQ